MKVTASHVISVSRVVETILTPDPIKVYPGDIVYLPDMPALKALMERETSQPVFFAAYGATMRRGQFLVCKGPQGLRGYKVGGANPPPAEKLPKPTDGESKKGK